MEKRNMEQYCGLVSEKFKSIERLAEEYARAAGLTPMGLTILGIIYDNSEDCTQKFICRKSQYNKQSVNMIIKSFVEQGYIELVEMKKDRRNKHVRLSEAGKRYADKVVGLLYKTENDALGKMKPEQREALTIFLDTFEECFRIGIGELADNGYSISDGITERD